MLSRKPGEIQKEFRDMPEKKLTDDLESIGYSMSIFNGNYHELKKILTALTDKGAIQFWAMRNRPRKNLFMRELLRHLHNYVGSYISLRDHTDRIFKDKEFPEYRKERGNRLDIELMVFVTELRNYAIHYGVLPVKSELSGGRDKETKIRILLDPNTLLQNPKFEPRAREYIKKNKTLDLSIIIQKHYTQIREFYDWLVAEYAKKHKKEFEKINAIMLEFQRELVNQGLQSSISSAKTFQKDNPDDAFVEYFSDDELRYLEQFESNSKEKCEKILELLEKRVKLTEETKNEIRKIYSEFKLPMS
jgi:hypothetical protein